MLSNMCWVLEIMYMYLLHPHGYVTLDAEDPVTHSPFGFFVNPSMDVQPP